MKIKVYFLLSMILIIINVENSRAMKCGCRMLRGCYKFMLDALMSRNEEACIEDAGIGISTIEVFLRALKIFCPEYITVYEDGVTYEFRHLYEVILNIPLKDQQKESEKPVIMIDAGQRAGPESVGLALYLIEQLMGCQENEKMMNQVKWVILPSTNPDGMQHVLATGKMWSKNMRHSDNQYYSFGVDISRNFETQWVSCKNKISSFSNDYPGSKPASENETIFIQNAIIRYKKNLKLYLSIRRGGHALLYPYSFSASNVTNLANLSSLAGKVAERVNLRSGGVHIFENKSIFKANGVAWCGHSVDYAYDRGVPLAYEMRVFLGGDTNMLSKFQRLPRGYEVTLRLGYFSGIRELFNSVVNGKNFQKLFN